MKVGICLPQWTLSMGNETPRGTDIIRLAAKAEAIGLDSVWLVDHFYYEPYVDRKYLGQAPPPELQGVWSGAWECWSLASALAVTTSRLEIGTLVSNTGYRNPALLARIADTVDELSHGRLILGLGAGDYLSEHEAFGYPWERRVSRFEEALQIIRPLLRGEEVSFDGEFYRTRKAALLPRGPRPGGPPVIIGVVQGGPRMSRLVAQRADAWNCWLAFGDSRARAYEKFQEPIMAACDKYGRNPQTLGRNVTVCVCPTGDRPPRSDASPLTGGPAEIAEQLERYAALHVDHLTALLYPNTDRGLEALAPIIERLG